MRIATVFLITIATMLPSCAGVDHRPGPDACTTEQGIVGAVGAGIAAADGLLPEEADDALSIARGVAQLGAAAVSACELARDGAGWQQWVGLALEAVSGLVAHFTGASAGDSAAEPPPQLLQAEALLRAELGATP